MLGILYLALCFGTGFALLYAFFAPLCAVGVRTLAGGRVNLFAPFVRLPAAFVIGFITLGWVAYGAGWLARNTAAPMTAAGAAGLAAGLVITGWGLLRRKKGHRAAGGRAFGKTEAAVLLMALAAGWMISFYCFWQDAEGVHVAVNIYSDFSPHIAVIRSFSQGGNFPTQYPHFPDGTMRYHFMFFFAAGLLEYLGLPITAALNLPTLFSFMGLWLLLYTLAHAATGSRLAAALAPVMMYFRSGFAFFTFLAARPADTSLWQYITQNSVFIGTTTNENWGLFCVNVYANQRHLALGMCLVLLAILYFWPCFLPGKRGPFLLGREAWLPDRGNDCGLPMGLLLGAAAFWHGSMVISALMILAGMAAVSRRRLGYLVTAICTVILSSLQSRFFTGGSNPLQLQIKLGFLADSSKPAAIAEYIVLLTGVFFALYLIGLIWLAVKKRWKGCAFFAAALLPMVQAFTLQLTTEVAVSHKQVMLSLLLGGILNAWLLERLVQAGRLKAVRRAAAVLLFALLTVTGAEDMVTYRNLCQGTLVLSADSEMTRWISENTQPGDIFITHYITLHPVFTAGRFSYQGWPYYAWSAGYDTTGRDSELKKFLNPATEDLAAAAALTGCQYLVVDDELRRDERFYAFFEADGDARLAETFEEVFRGDEGIIYKIA